MNTASQFSLANRKQLADMLRDKYDGMRDRAKRKFHNRRRELETALILEFAENKGATKLIALIDVTKKKLVEMNNDLLQLGFDSDHGTLRLDDSRTNPLDEIIDGRIEKELGKVDDIDARFDSAQIAMMTVATLEDADKLLKSLSEV